jgi:hypothetical protein
VGDPTLEERAGAFAQEIQDTLDGVLPGEHQLVSRRLDDEVRLERFIVQPRGESAAERRIPVYVNGEQLASLSVSLYLELDRTKTYLKTVRSDTTIHAVLDRTPLVRLEYRADMHTEPIAHWQLHAERGAFSHLLARAHAHRPERVPRPHDLASLHLPVGGERFRPCLEDVLQFLVVDCGVDYCAGWELAIEAGRERWRRRQLGSAVRDVPSEAARVLRELGWAVAEPESNALGDNLGPLHTW